MRAGVLCGETCGCGRSLQVCQQESESDLAVDDDDHRISYIWKCSDESLNEIIVTARNVVHESMLDRSAPFSIVARHCIGEALR